MQPFYTMAVLALAATVVTATGSTESCTAPPGNCRTFSFLEASVHIRSSVHYSNNAGLSLRNVTGRQALNWVLDLQKDLPNSELTLEVIVDQLAAHKCGTTCWRNVLHIPVTVFCTCADAQLLAYADLLGFSVSTPLVKCPINKGLYKVVNFVPSVVSDKLIPRHTRVYYKFGVKGVALIDFVLEIYIDDSKCKK